METIWTIEILGMNMLQFTFYVGMVLAVVLIALILGKRRCAAQCAARGRRVRPAGLWRARAAPGPGDRLFFDKIFNEENTP